MKMYTGTYLSTIIGHTELKNESIEQKGNG